MRLHAAVGVVTSDDREHRRIHQFPDGGAADFRALVLARERRELFAFIDRQALDVGKPDVRVGMFGDWERSKSIKKRHVVQAVKLSCHSSEGMGPFRDIKGWDLFVCSNLRIGATNRVAGLCHNGLRPESVGPQYPGACKWMR